MDHAPGVSVGRFGRCFRLMDHIQSVDDHGMRIKSLSDYRYLDLNPVVRNAAENESSNGNARDGRYALCYSARGVPSISCTSVGETRDAAFTLQEVAPPKTECPLLPDWSHHPQ